MSNAAEGYIVPKLRMIPCIERILELCIFSFLSPFESMFSHGVLFHELHDVLHACHSATLHTIFHMLRKACYNLWEEVVDHVGGTFGQLLQIKGTSGIGWIWDTQELNLLSTRCLAIVSVHLFKNART